MPKSMATKAKKEPVNTEDRVMEGVVTAADWAERNRRLVTLGTIAVIAMLFAGWAYLDYRSKIAERAAVRLDEINPVEAAVIVSVATGVEVSALDLGRGAEDDAVPERDLRDPPDVVH